MKILVVGSVALDKIETPFGASEIILGGAGSYIALSSSYFSNAIDLISTIGYDFPQKYLEMLKNKNINIEGIEQSKTEKTFFWSGKYHNDMNSRDSLVTELNVLGKFDPTISDKSKDAEIIMLGNLLPSVQDKVLQQVKNPKIVVLDTMNYWMDTALEELIKVISKIQILTINDEEARQLSGEYSLVKAAKKILAMGPEYLVIKKGEHGALLFSKKEIFYVPALPLEEVFDPTGAGDSFAGGMVGYLSKNNLINFNSLKKAVIYGSAMASFCVEKFGTKKLQNLSLEEIENRVEKFAEIVKFY